MVKQNKKTGLFPNVMVCIGYKNVFDDYATVNIKEVIKGIPSMAIIHFIVEQYNRVLYAFSDTKLQKQQIRDYCRYVSKSTKERLWKFTRENTDCFIYETYGCSMALGYVFQNFTNFESDDDELELCEEEYENVLKLILYCNQKWTDGQSGDNLRDPIDVSLKVDLPVVEFKFFKDFKFQIYKAILLFEFLESDPYYKNILPSFCADKRVRSWQDYLMQIFSFYYSSLEGQYIKIDSGNPLLANFFSQYCVNLDDCGNLSEGHNALNYFRDHFLLDCGNDNFLLINANMLVDKLYQSVRFDLYKTIEVHSIKNKKGKDYNGLPDFNGCLGQDFSEPMLLYSLMKKTFEGRCSKLITGAELKSKGIEAEPDLYMRMGTVLYLFEFKDITLGDGVKYSSNIDAVKSAICDRICKIDGKPKGAGQLHNTIDSILNHHIMDGEDPDVVNITDIVPIIVTTDRAFSALGVQALVVQESEKFPKIHFKGFLSVPIVVDLDTLIDLSYRLNKGFLNFTQLIKDYMYGKSSNIQSFSVFVFDNYKRKNNVVSKEETDFLFSDIVEHMVNGERNLM